MLSDIKSVELGKRSAAAKAIEYVKNGMTLGLGTGSTASYFIEFLAERISREGLQVLCVPTSKTTLDQAASLKIPLTSLEKVDTLDLVVDGADEFDHDLNMIKGGGGALLQEKIVATASKRMVVITDSSKESSSLGTFDLPVEIIRFGANSTKDHVKKALENMGHKDVVIRYRKNKNNENFVTDEGHLIIDLILKKINDPDRLQRQLIKCVGVVETGLFIGMAHKIIVGNSDGSVKLITDSNNL